MAIDAKIIPVMIASPGDVSEERNAVRNTINNWNSVNSIHERLSLLPLSWETNAAPDLSGRPQGLINDRILEKCDLLVGVFWTRLGTPTGKHESGTVEEIKEHVAAGKTAMVYFSSKPVVPGSYDDEQYQKLLAFKAWCETKGLINSFDSIEEFEKGFKDDLVLILRDNPYLNSLTSSSAPIQSADDVQIRSVSLDEIAIDLLVKAARSENGMIMRYRTLDGTTFQAGSEKIEHDGSRKAVARLEAAIEELESYSMIRDVGYKQEIFEVTHEGYQAVERTDLN